MKFTLRSLTIILLLTIHAITGTALMSKSPNIIETYHEIATRYDQNLAELYNNLTSQERIFAYYLFRASLPGHSITADQYHRHNVTVITACEHIYAQRELLQKKSSHNLTELYNQLQTYLVYLWTNHGQYFNKDHKANKRTPSCIGCHLITKETLLEALQKLELHDHYAALSKVDTSYFTPEHEQTTCIPNDIAASAVNFYAPDFTEEDFQALPTNEKTHLNAYYYVDHSQGIRLPKVERYKIGGRYSKELSVAAHWLTKAKEHAMQHPQLFDNHIVNSLELLVKFLHSGDEQDFREHSKAWLKTNSNLDYVFGFIENYDDPKEFRGMFQAEVTIKRINLETLNALLPSLELQLPFPSEYKRENLDDISAIPNASINTMLFGMGHLGPLEITAAYCLPNYTDIRTEYGSKQIIYAASGNIGLTLNPELYLKLFFPEKEASWLAKNDPQLQLISDLWNVHCILHETLGHGSGRLHLHTFKEGDPLTIGGVTYKVGNSIPVTRDNKNEFFAGSGQALEELRAEIIALYTSIFNFDELAAAGLYKQWPEILGKEALIDHLILDMARTALRRLLSQPEDSTEIIGAHAQANTTITNWLLDHGGLALIIEPHMVNGVEHKVLGLEVVDRAQALAAIKELTIVVQTIKSTADGQQLHALLETYGKHVRNLDHVRWLKANQKAVSGNIRVTARIFPHFEPICSPEGTITDIHISWPENIIEQWMTYRTIMHSYKL